MLEDLNELEKVGLAFLAGLAAGDCIEKADQEAVGKIEGEKAEKFIKMMKELGVE